jgi:hypothetical protein
MSITNTNNLFRLEDINKPDKTCMLTGIACFKQLKIRYSRKFVIYDSQITININFCL